MTDSKLVEELLAGREQVVDFFSGLDSVAVNTPATASEHPGGRPWSAKDHLAHLVQRESSFLPIARRVIDHEPYPTRLESRGDTPEERSIFVNRENQAVIENRQHQTVAGLLEEFVALRSQLVSMVEGLSSNDLVWNLAVTAERDAAVGILLGSSDRHARAHLQTLRGVLIEASTESGRLGAQRRTP